MTELYDAARMGDLKRVTLLVGQGVDKNQVGGPYGQSALDIATEENHLTVVEYLVEQGADMEKENMNGNTSLLYASEQGHVEVTRYLLQQGANRDKANKNGCTSLHFAAQNNQLETAKLLMVYGADLNARNEDGELPIELTLTEEMRQAIRDEPRRRMDHGHKRATEQDRHPNAAASESGYQEGEAGEEQSNKKPRLDEVAEAEGRKIAEEDKDSEPSDDEDDDN